MAAQASFKPLRTLQRLVYSTPQQVTVWMVADGPSCRVWLVHSAWPSLGVWPAVERSWPVAIALCKVPELRWSVGVGDRFSWQFDTGPFDHF